MLIPCSYGECNAFVPLVTIVFVKRTEVASFSSFAFGVLPLLFGYYSKADLQLVLVLYSLQVNSTQCFIHFKSFFLLNKFSFLSISSSKTTLYNDDIF